MVVEQYAATNAPHSIVFNDHTFCLQAVSVQTEELRQVTVAHDHLNADKIQLQAQAAQIQVTEPQHAQQAEAVEEYAQLGPFGQKTEATQLAEHAQHDSAELIKAHHLGSHEVCFFLSLLLVLLCTEYAHSISPQVQNHPDVSAMIAMQDMGCSLALSGARMVANAVDSCVESADSLPSADSCQVSSCNKSKCVIMVTRFLHLLDTPLCNALLQLKSSPVDAKCLAATHAAESCHLHAECVSTLSVQMSDADDRQARALVPEGPTDDEATTGQQAATAAEMDSITSRDVLPATSPPQQVSCCSHPQR